MASEVKLPDIGEGVTEGELVKWLVKVGDTVKVDQPVAEVMTDKATVEVPSPYAGTVKELKLKEGDMIPIESVMLILDGAGAAAAPEKKSAPAAPAQKPAAASHAAKPAAMSAASSSAPTSTSGGRSGGGLDVHPPVAGTSVLATPATRRLARELEVDINSLNGSGNAGRVTREDVLSVKSGAGAVAAGSPRVNAPAHLEIPKYSSGVSQQGKEERVALRGIRRKIAEQMQMTKQIVPHFTLMDEANVTKLSATRGEAKKHGEKFGVNVTFLPFVMKALIATVREFPMFNASIDDQAGEIVYKKYFNVGFAADTPQGLMVPNVKDADTKSLLQLSKEIQELAGKARAGKLSLEEMKGATITITNIGSVGGTYATPIINHPEVAILGMYKILERPIFVEGKLEAAKIQNYTITCDHRLIDGAVAANFLKSFLSRIENPAALMLDL